MNAVKKCIRCCAEKPVEEFTKSKRSNDGLAYYCRGCYRDLYIKRRDARRAKPKKCRICNAHFPFSKKIYCDKCVKERKKKRNTNYNSKRYREDAVFRERVKAQSKRRHQSLYNIDEGYTKRYKANTRRRTIEQYGITQDLYDLMMILQGHTCAICGAPPDDYGSIRRLSIDHCHATGTVRGLLCKKCNVGLGAFKDEPELLRHAADYIERGNSPCQLLLTEGDALMPVG